MKTMVRRTVDAATPRVPGCVEIPTYGNIGTLRRCEAPFNEPSGEATPKQAISEATLKQASGKCATPLDELAGEATPRQALRSYDVEWIDVEEFSPYQGVDEGFDFHCEREYSFPYLFLLASQLNGHNGSVTGSDDVSQRDLKKAPPEPGETSVKKVVPMKRKPEKNEALSQAEVDRRSAQSAADRNFAAKRRHKEAETNRHRKNPNTASREKSSTPKVAESKGDSRVVVEKTPPDKGVDCKVIVSGETSKPAAPPELKRDSKGKIIVGGGVVGFSPGHVNHKAPPQEKPTVKADTPDLVVPAEVKPVAPRAPPVVRDVSTQVDAEGASPESKKHESPAKTRRRERRAEGRDMDFESVKEFVEKELASMTARDPSVYPVSQHFVNSVTGPGISTKARAKIFHRLTIGDLMIRNKAWSEVLIELQQTWTVDSVSGHLNFESVKVYEKERNDMIEDTLYRAACLSYFREVLAQKIVVDYEHYSRELQLFFQDVEYHAYLDALPPHPLRDPYNYPAIIMPESVRTMRRWISAFRNAVLPQLQSHESYRYGYRVAEGLIPASNNDGIRREYSEARYEGLMPEYRLRIDAEKNPKVSKVVKRIEIIPRDPKTDYLILGASSSLGKILLDGKERDFAITIPPKASAIEEPVTRYQNMLNIDTNLPLKLKFVEVASRRPKNSFGQASEMTRAYKRFRYFVGHLGQYYARRCLPAFAHDVNHRRFPMQLEVANPFKANHEVAFWESSRTSNLGYEGFEENVLIESDLLGEMLREHASTNSFSADLQSRLLYSGRKWLVEHTNVPMDEVILLNNTVRYAYLQLQINRAALNEVLVTTVNSTPS